MKMNMSMQKPLSSATLSFAVILLVTLFAQRAQAGTTFDEGLPVARPQNLARLVSSAEHGFGPAQYRLGWAYARGFGVPRKPVNAFYWWKEAAKNLDAAAQLQVGIAYAKGFGVETSMTRAIHWWKLAARDGHPGVALEAQRLLDSAV